jgi:hypothetical protein
MTMRTSVVLILAVFALFARNVPASEAISCPLPQSDKKIFKIPSMSKTSVAIETANGKNYLVALATYRSIDNGRCEKHISRNIPLKEEIQT